MTNFCEHTNRKCEEDNLLRRSSGVPVDDGSQAFRNHINDRISASYDRDRIVSLAAAMTFLEERHKKRFP